MTELGERYRITPDFDQLNAAATLKTQAGEHLWILIVSYGLTDQEAAEAHEGVTQLLDPNHLLAVTPVGCYICEREYSAVAGQPCKGLPSSYNPDGTPRFE